MKQQLKTSYWPQILNYILEMSINILVRRFVCIILMRTVKNEKCPWLSSKCA